ncbi:MAG: BtpA/SgcQ family protein [Phycisphaerae bacterium]|nr:BtpA/SgcQ family protein [Phycisphaerae bacterium]
MLDFPSPALIGVIHLPGLPGSPLHTLSMEEILNRAVSDARTLKGAGFDAAIVENFGDAPFPKDNVSPASVAAMAIVADHVRRESGLRIGINALRNDAVAALGIAAAAGAGFIRVNIHTGVYATDQGLIEGRADETLRYRRLLGRRVAILADVHVKHATPLGHADIAAAARDTAYRGLADGLIVTGPATGSAVDFDDLTNVRHAVPDRRIFVGSGATADTVASLLNLANGVIVGTGIKPGGDPAAPIDAALATSFAHAAGRS